MIDFKSILKIFMSVGLIVTVMLAGFTTSVLAGEVNDAAQAVTKMQKDWAKINYQSVAGSKKDAFEELVDKANVFTIEYPNDAGVWIWNGIINSSYAGARGGLGALKYAKQARFSLENALELDDEALAGSAYTSLGTLYSKVPGWPAGFGSKKKAAQMLQKALEINPKGIDSNYFYGDYLIDRKQYSDAQRYLEAAQSAAPRAGRDIADRGRQEEIKAALTMVNSKLGHNTRAKLDTGLQ